MCELLGMSANVPTDICFSFTGLMQRGGGTGPHKDGWGIAFYEGRAVREFRDTRPSVGSEIARLVKGYPIKSHIVISHIRRANAGRVCLENTHPFTRELWGRQWTFAHNGQLPGIKKALTLDFYQPIGTTDSEFAFCWMLSEIRRRFTKQPRRPQTLWRELNELCTAIKEFGVFNLLMSDSKYLYCFCSTKLFWVTRKAPFNRAVLKDAEVEVDFKHETTPDDIVTVIATEPLTANEQWHQMQAGQMCVFRHGLICC
ncbi:class II glutamine amidotransferase [Zooshikella marina]|uniref:Class II glutamine amidotransferase n=1 Tax=Zooshikella ganghwensis TaxID=202772 RepID=A0A4P9VJS8_9GAMM|nr:class II glutamine amidotransferase [Zooshikella ganghwensis]MBU2707025.1 class II glutamine amidotransferase [Zooshikella ganghwensis]RDH43503.1 class II glutamine amidotransferase [Zooshikella ganghwensis]